MTGPVTIRPFEPGDVAPLLAVYNHYVLHTPVTFDIEPRTLAQRQEWFSQFASWGRHRCLVAVRNGQAIGWAASARYHARAAYDTSVETSIYLAPDERGRGLGRRLYAALFEALKGEDIHRAYGGVTQPNDASNRLHEVLGFERAGYLKEIGRKFDRYWDVAVYLRPMG